MSLTLPELGYGASAIAGMYRSVTAAEAEQVLETAWADGLRYFDVAPHYGQGLAERRLGDFLRDKPTEEWILSTKVGRILTPSTEVHDTLNGFVDPLPFDQHYDYSYDGIMRSVEDSYHRLGLHKIDILFVHDLGDAGHSTDDPELIKVFLESGQRALSELKAQGSIRAIGIGVNGIAICEELLEHMDLDLILLAGRYTLLEQRKALPLLKTCQSKGTQLVIGGVFNSGILATGPVPGAYFDYAPASEEVLARVRSMEAICQDHGIPLAAAALQFPNRHPFVASTLIGTAKSKTLSRNLEQFQTPIPDALWSDLEGAGLFETAGQ